MIKQIPITSSHLKLSGFLYCLLFFSGCAGSEELSEAPETLPIMSEQISETMNVQPNDENESEREKSPEEIRLENELRQNYSRRANELTNFYIYAQHLFYNSDFEEAFYWIEKAEEVQTNADVLALKGNIYLGLGDFEEFENYWRRALEMDKNVPIPYIPAIVRELQKRGLLDEDLKKNF